MYPSILLFYCYFKIKYFKEMFEAAMLDLKSYQIKYFNYAN